MRDDLKRIEEIDRYLNNQMTSDESNTFEQEMKFDQALRDDVAYQREIIQSIRRKALSEQIILVSNRGGLSLKWSVWITSGLALLTIGFFLWNSSLIKNDNESHHGSVDTLRDYILKFSLLDTTDPTFDKSTLASVNIPDGENESEPEKEIELLAENSKKSVRTHTPRSSGSTNQNEKIQEKEEETGNVVVVSNDTIPEPQTIVVESHDLTEEVTEDEYRKPITRPASFKGGEEALRKYIESFTIKSISKRREGKIYIDFIIDESGIISDVQVIQGVSRRIDAQAVELVEEMPDWIPAMKNGKFVSTAYRLPIYLDLRE